MSRYEQIETLRDTDGVEAVITKRVDSDIPFFSFTIRKVFIDKASTEQVSPWLNRRHTAAMRRLLTRVEDYLDQQIDRARAGRQAG